MDWLELLGNLADVAPDDRHRFLSRPDPPITLDLRDEPCVRCRKPMRYSSPAADGVPTCASCLAEMQRPRATRACPVDGRPLEAAQVSNVAIDRCPACGGVWLDGGELEVVTEAAVQAAKRSPEEAGDLLATVLVGLPARKASPPVEDELL
jgi:Transcription factor zinc-finger